MNRFDLIAFITLHTFTLEASQQQSELLATKQFGFEVLVKSTPASVEWSGVSVWGTPVPNRKQHENREE